MLNVKHAVSWADEERDLTAWIGNNLQWEAFDNLYALSSQVALIDDESIRQDWLRLQNSDHFYYMCTKYFSDGAVHQYFNPFKSPYDAFINYMNVLSDFTERVKKAPKRNEPRKNTFVLPVEENAVKQENKVKTSKKTSTQSVKKTSKVEEEVPKIVQKPRSSKKTDTESMPTKAKKK